MAEPREIVAAGVVVLRKAVDRDWSVLLVHRPKYDDWSFPKGKLDRGEHPAAAAVREVHEETGLEVRLHQPLQPQRYLVAKGPKVVHYWVGRVLDGRTHDVSGYHANDEIDRVAWVPASEAAARLTYPHDRTTLVEALLHRRRTSTLVVLRHGEAWARRGWHQDDRCRPLLASGRRQAAALVPLLAAYDVRRVVSSTSTRCVETVGPYLDSRGLPGELLDLLSEEDGDERGVRQLTGTLVAQLDEHGPTVLCTHRPVLPWVFAALGLADPGLDKGELLVAHVRRGRVLATKRHQV